VQNREKVEEMVESLNRETVIGIDTEFIRETTFFPRIALIQVATEKETWLLDPLALKREDLTGFLDVLKNKGILKVMHAAYADQECLYWAYGFLAEPVLDTAVGGALCGYGDNVGLGKLLKEMFRLQLPKGRARAKWLVRPLPKELLHYAEQDVAHLVRLGRALQGELERRNRLDWAMEESTLSVALFEVSPEELARKIARNGQIEGQAFPVLVELLRWRENRAKQANIPRAWVADNDILVALAKVRPESIEELRSFRGLNAKEVERSGATIINAIREGRAKPVDETAIPVRQPSSNDRDDHVMEFIRTYASFLAARHEIALRYLINTNKAIALTQQKSEDEETWVREGILTRRACDLIGSDLKALLEGKRALVLKNGKLEVRELA
jgi:ribonuclease D